MSLPAPPSSCRHPLRQRLCRSTEPPVRTFTPPSPVRLTAALDPLASTFSKPVTFAVSPELWSADDRLIVAVPLTTRVSVLAPPAIDPSTPS